MENYQKILDKTIENLNGGETLLLHSCCGPCSSYVLEYLSQYFKITILFCNPNISPQSEFDKRVVEQKKVIANTKAKYPIDIIVDKYDPDEFYERVAPYKDLGEKTQRCYECYDLRIGRTFDIADEMGFDFVTTTLSVSPHKNSQWINEIGEKLEQTHKTKFLHSDFKKKNGYKRSIELSKEFDLYRQDYCGCVYSKKEAEQRHNNN